MVQVQPLLLCCQVLGKLGASGKGKGSNREVDGRHGLLLQGLGWADRCPAPDLILDLPRGETRPGLIAWLGQVCKVKLWWATAPGRLEKAKKELEAASVLGHWVKQIGGRGRAQEAPKHDLAGGGRASSRCGQKSLAGVQVCRFQPGGSAGKKCHRSTPHDYLQSRQMREREINVQVAN